MQDNLEIARAAQKAAEDKKGEDVIILDIREIADFADYFVLATGKNRNQMEAMADAVDEALIKGGAVHKCTEGNKDSGWILMDYGDVIVHLFDEESRSFYDLERIWKDGKAV